MLVYRVESFSQKGAYSSAVMFPSIAGKHPCPSEDALLMANGWNEVESSYRYYFGFCSLEQLLEWFPISETWPSFIEHNTTRDSNSRMGISVYEVDEKYAIIGNTQTVFILENAERLRIINFEDEINNVIPA